MNILKIIVLISFGFVLLNCDNAKPASNHSSADSLTKPNNDLLASQNLEINAVKNELPIEIDELTTLFDVFADNNIIHYKYRVKNTPKQALLLTSTLDTLRSNLLDDYCQNVPQMKELKNVFPNGAHYHYFINNEEIIIVELNPDDCQTDK
ncbi:hypothetical protein ACGH6R_06265 [Gilliamella sp. CG13]|uniref:hypothetical protein n=1 Tax=Gilliamella sp. CG13 TaxID=3351502 RepID=UPI0039889E45